VRSAPKALIRTWWQRFLDDVRFSPRVIAFAEEFPEHVALPRGCLADLEGLLRGYGVALVVEDQQITGEPLEVDFNGQLTTVQQAAAHALLAHDIGVFVAPPGIGKTVVGTYLVAQRARSTLILVHRHPLLDQWVAQLSTFLSIDPKAIGRIGEQRCCHVGWRTESLSNARRR
jgi:hypothetical protein